MEVGLTSYTSIRECNNCLFDSIRCEKEYCERLIHEFFHTPYFLEWVEPVPGAFEVLSSLKEEFEFHLVTSRQLVSKYYHRYIYIVYKIHSQEVLLFFVVQGQTITWINQHYPGIFEKLHFGNHYGFTGLKKTKSDMCMEIKACLLIDDSLKYAFECSKVLPQVILFGSYAWNVTTSPLPLNCPRALNWGQVKELLLDVHSKRI